MELNHKEFGEGQPVIILHGLFGSLDNWQTIAKKIGEHFRVFIIDQRNHGKSPHSDEHSFQLMANDLKEFIDEHELSSPHIVGHSMGGKAAMCFAVTYPELLDKLVVVDIAPRAYKPHHDLVFRALFDLDLHAVENRTDADEKMSQWIAEPPVRQFLLKNLARNEQGGFEWKFNLKALFQNYEQINVPLKSDKNVNVSTLVIKGSESNYIVENDLTDFKTLFGQVQLVEIKNAGHWVHAEAPKEFADVLNKFLQ